MHISSIWLFAFSDPLRCLYISQTVISNIFFKWVLTLSFSVPVTTWSPILIKDGSGEPFLHHVGSKKSKTKEVKVGGVLSELPHCLSILCSSSLGRRMSRLTNKHSLTSICNTLKYLCVCVCLEKQQQQQQHYGPSWGTEV